MLGGNVRDTWHAVFGVHYFFLEIYCPRSFFCLGNVSFHFLPFLCLPFNQLPLSLLRELTTVF